MLIPYSKIIHAPVFELRHQQKLGVIEDIIIKKSDLSVYGLLIKTLDFIPKTKVVSASDIAELASGAVVINEEKSLIDIKETIRLNDAVKQGCTGLKQKVVTGSGKRIGRVFDYLVSSSDLTITKFYIHSLLSEKIIASNAITKFDGKIITITDDFELVVGTPELVPKAEAA